MVTLMSRTLQPMTQVEVRVKGSVGRVLSAALEGEIALESRTETVLSGRITDQAELHSLLARIRDLGLDLVDVRVAESSG